MEVRPGYKLTEVGVIPEDWELVKLGSLAQIQRGASPRPIDSPIWFDPASRVGWVRISDIAGSDGKHLTHTRDYLSAKGIAASRFLPTGTLIMSICATVGVPVITCLDVCIHDGFVSFTRVQHVEQQFLYYKLQQMEPAFRSMGQTGSQNNLNSELVRRSLVALPPTKAEQQAIAEALSDADVLITSLEHLIAKKRQLKQGAMQALLTGKRRLPGFGGEWVEVKMSDYFTPVTTRNEELNDNVATISAQQGFVRQEEFFSKRVASEVLSNYYLLQRGHFAYNRSSSNGYPYGAIKLLNRYEKAVVTTLYICFRPKDDKRTCAPFFGQYFDAGLLNEGLATVANEGGRAHGLLNVTKDDFFSRPLRVPPLSEQIAIAAVLSDMDAEIAALEIKLGKARQLKQGMMHDLLTGRIRLV